MWGWSCIFLLRDSLRHCQSHTGAEEPEEERREHSQEEETSFSRAAVAT